MRVRLGWMIRCLIAVAAVTVAAPPPCRAETPAGTAFTFQGDLRRSNRPATGTFDLQFKIFDAPTGSVALGTILREDVGIREGRFTVRLDFGGNVFEGAARWLEIGVRRADQTGGFETLAPRQELTPTPYAIFALEAGRPPEAAPQRQLAAEFTVADGQSIQAGDVVGYIDGKAVKGFPGSEPAEFVFNEGATDMIFGAPLGGNRFAVAYQDEANSDVGAARIGTITGDQVEFGSEFIFNAGPTGTYDEAMGAAALSDSSFVVAYSDQGGIGAVIVGEVSGASINYGPEAVFDPLGSVENISVTALSPSRFVVAFYRQTAKVVLGSVSGNLISLGTPIVFETDTSNESIVTARISDSRFVLAYLNRSRSTSVAIVGDVLGDALLLGPKSDIYSIMSSADLSVAAMSETSIVLASVTSSVGPAVAWTGTIAGNSIIVSAPFPFYHGNCFFVDVIGLDGGRILITYRDGENLGAGVRITGELVDGEIAYRGKQVFRRSSTLDNYTFRKSNGPIISAFSDWGDFRIGKAIIQASDDTPIPLGIARTSAQAGQKVLVVTDGISDVHAGLTPERFYYARPDGSLTRTRTEVPVGWALSPTEILLRGEFGPPKL